MEIQPKKAPRYRASKICFFLAFASIVMALLASSLDEEFGIIIFLSFALAAISFAAGLLVHLISCVRYKMQSRRTSSAQIECSEFDTRNESINTDELVDIVGTAPNKCAEPTPSEPEQPHEELPSSSVPPIVSAPASAPVVKKQRVRLGAISAFINCESDDEVCSDTVRFAFYEQMKPDYIRNRSTVEIIHRLTADGHCLLVYYCGQPVGWVERSMADEMSDALYSASGSPSIKFTRNDVSPEDLKSHSVTLEYIMNEDSNTKFGKPVYGATVSFRHRVID